MSLANPELQLAEAFVVHTNCTIFLTGKAGTGNTTFLHRIGEQTHKRLVVTDGQPRMKTTSDPAKTTLRGDVRLIDLRQTVMEQGQRTLAPESIDCMAERCRRDLSLLPQGCRRFVNPHHSKVSISPRLKELRCALIQAVTSGRKE